MQTWMIFTPAAVALVAIVLTRKAALALLLACLTACLVLAKGNPLIGLRELFVEHAFPALSGSWHIGPVIFTLLLGAFAQLLERSGGFSSLMKVGEGGDIRGRQSKTLLGVFGMGLLCFFDGLANAMLLGRVARPLVDRLGMARQVLAYVIDSTSSAVACVAFISTWIATQLSLIGDGLEGSGLEVTPVDVYFRSIPANPYCWIALAMVAIVVARHWWIGPMKHYVKNVEPVECEDEPEHKGSWISVVVPVLTLLMSVPAAIYLFQEGDDWSWANAFAGSYVRHAMVLGGVVALVAGVMWGSKTGVQFSLSLLALKALPVLILGGFTSIPGAIVGGLIIGAGEKLAEVYLSQIIGGGIEGWFAFMLAMLFLMFRPQGLFGDKIIERV